MIKQRITPQPIHIPLDTLLQPRLVLGRVLVDFGSLGEGEEGGGGDLEGCGGGEMALEGFGEERGAEGLFGEGEGGAVCGGEGRGGVRRESRKLWSMRGRDI